MTGNGTQDNPYVPENWDELKQAAETADAYIQLPSDTYWGLANVGVGGINLRCYEIDGNGAIINKLRLTTPILFSLATTSHDVTIKNLNILNAYVANAGVFWCVSSSWVYHNQIQLRNFVFTGGLYNSQLWNCDNQGVTTNRCLFSLYLNNSTLAVNENQINNTAFLIDGTVSSRINVPFFNSSEIKGDISGVSPTELIVAGQLSIIDADLENYVAVSEHGSNPSVLLNTDRIGTAVIQGNFIEATSTQMQDVEWLNQHGFPCNS